jgi:probable rRNA maturation factor
VNDLALHIQNDDDRAAPQASRLELWIDSALRQSGFGTAAELTLRIVGESEMQDLNYRYRNTPRPTNVLAFAADLPPQLGLPLLGDIVICAPLVEREAGEQGKTMQAHWAHLVVHGTLHLLGHDHVDDTEALLMEQLETAILRNLGFADPYAAPVGISERPTTP